MFTGIVKGVFPVSCIESKEQFATLSVALPAELLKGLETGASIAINGTCLTVTAFNDSDVTFDAMQETLRVTNLGDLEQGTPVNIERAARFGDEIGGHLLSGHIHDTVVIDEVIKTPDNTTVFFRFDGRWSDYILPKGYIALNGCSLTIGEEVKDNRFCVHLIPETLKLTTFGRCQVGDRVNLEIDSQTQAVVNTVKSYLKSGRS
ncbi:riboflavin synthase subunit alpha [Endozoicomonas montiporae]|uniref:Riboflavin synthase n=2 Tax=Endozoicomonas montiporae TaxID=1027273 RepID=A0A081NAN4_9GAMM|nr:riboflavin synthase [Endozoicomonas montiporae]AMO56809.1 riboflavin synthase subunit alpha [Endozoicomonas montiporae CL-33]KEQ15507.1 riboflavin synthase subunit alpha [Endozoicomonas montiporae]